MLLTYVDESYTRERYLLAALVVPDRDANSLTAALDAVAESAAAEFGHVRPTAELHGYDLVAGKRDWAGLAPKVRARIAVYNRALRVIADHNVAVLLRSVDIARLQRRYPTPDHPHSIALAHLVERVDEHAAGIGELVLIIADEVDRQDDYRRELWRYQRLRTRGYRARRITQVVDTIHFAPSASSRLLQAADLIAYLARRRATHVESDPRAQKANAALWARIEPRVVHNHCWLP